MFLFIYMYIYKVAIFYVAQKKLVLKIVVLVFRLFSVFKCLNLYKNKSLVFLLLHEGTAGDVGFDAYMNQ